MEWICYLSSRSLKQEHIMHLRTHAIMEKLSVGSSRNTFLTLRWNQCFSMGWKYGVVVSLNLLGKSLKMSKNIFLPSFYRLRNKRPTPSPSLRRNHFPLRSWPWKELLNTCLRFKKSPSHWLSRICMEASKVLCSNWMQDMGSWASLAVHVASRSSWIKQTSSTRVLSSNRGMHLYTCHSRNFSWSRGEICSNAMWHLKNQNFLENHKYVLTVEHRLSGWDVGFNSLRTKIIHLLINVCSVTGFTFQNIHHNPCTNSFAFVCEPFNVVSLEFILANLL